MQDSQRKLKFWLNLNCPQQYNWIVFSNFAEIISHTERQCYLVSRQQYRENGIHKLITSTELELFTAEIKHTYFTHMTSTKLITLIETTNNQIFLIKNSATDHSSNIYHIVNDIKDILLVLNNAELKLLNLKHWLKTKFTAPQERILKDICFLDLMSSSKPELNSKIKQWIVGRTSGNGTKILNFAHQYAIQDADLHQLKESSSENLFTGVEMIILAQNLQFRDFTWLTLFPRLKSIAFESCKQVSNEMIQQICHSAPHLESLRLNHCLFDGWCRYNARLLLDVLKLPQIKHLSIVDKHFCCQISPTQWLITAEEWKGIDSSLESLELTSQNLSIDIVDDLLKSCVHLKHLMIDSSILQMVQRNIRSNENGLEENEYVTFQSCEQSNRGFKISRPVHFEYRSLFKNRPSSFSESMYNKIKKDLGEHSS